MTSSLQYSASAKHWLWGRFLKGMGRVPVRKHWRQDRVERCGRCVNHLYLQWHHCLHCHHCPSLWSLSIIAINVCLCKSMQKAELWALRACCTLVDSFLLVWETIVWLYLRSKLISHFLFQLSFVCCCFIFKLISVRQDVSCSIK